MSNYKNGRIDFFATAIEPIIHGAGTEGNTQMLRGHKTVLPDGTIADVPFVSANSWAHQIRVAGVQFALRAMGLEAEGSLGTENIIHLLFSGGALTKNAVKLDTARRLERLFPVLGLLGYSAGNTMTRGKLQIGHWSLVCKENAHTLPGWIVDRRHAELPQDDLRAETFQVRHDATRDHNAMRLLPAAVRSEIEDVISSGEKRENSTQMISEAECIARGAKLWSQIWMHGVSDIEISALRCALEEACLGMAADGGFMYRLGGKTNRGFGLISTQISGSLREQIRTPNYTETDMLHGFNDSSAANDKRDEYIDHLMQNRDEIMRLLKDISA